MSEWYIARGGEQFGPMDRRRAVGAAAKWPDAYAWRQGFQQWRPVAEVRELGPEPALPVPTRRDPPRLYADDVDFEIHGHEMQYVEVELDPGESAIAEAGAMMYKGPEIAMTTIFGDGSGQDDSVVGRLMGAGKRVLTGEGMFTTVFTHEGRGKARIAFAAPTPGHIVPVSLKDVGERLICQKDSLLCAAKGVTIGIRMQRKILTGLFGGEGFIMQSLDGDGMVFLHAGGTVVERTLAPREELHVDTGCLVAIDRRVGFDVQFVGGVRSALLGGEGLFYAKLVGPGRVWLQSLPFSRLAGRMGGALGGRKGR
ncbi:MAG: AIM24 family protein [Pseudomonadota bacterium]